MYECAEFETKKMIISILIERIEVSRDYQVKVTFNVTLEQFLEMLAPTTVAINAQEKTAII